MNPQSVTERHRPGAAGVQASEVSIAQLVGEVYEEAPPAERGRLLELLLAPLGVLALVSVANGIFARVRFRSGWPDMPIRLEDAQNVRMSDVVALVDYVQQVSVQAMDGLGQMVSASPVLASSGAAALLVALLMQRARSRRASDSSLDA